MGRRAAAQHEGWDGNRISIQINFGRTGEHTKVMIDSTYEHEFYAHTADSSSGACHCSMRTINISFVVTFWRTLDDISHTYTLHAARGQTGTPFDASAGARDSKDLTDGPWIIRNRFRPSGAAQEKERRFQIGSWRRRCKVCVVSLCSYLLFWTRSRGEEEEEEPELSTYSQTRKIAAQT